MLRDAFLIGSKAGNISSCGAITIGMSPSVPKKIGSWNQAIARNRRPILAAVGGLNIDGKTVRMFPMYHELSAEEKAFLQPFVDFISEQQKKRHTARVRRQWRELTKMHYGESAMYAPRFASMWFKFDERFGSCFDSSCRVLDVGCRTDPDQEPHYLHYWRMGAEAVGIDINVEDDPSKGVRRADARMLPFDDAHFHFITVASIFGSGNPACTHLEVAAGISELYRVLDNGLVHIGDMFLVPEVLHTAHMLGFRCFCNPKLDAGRIERNGIPLGALLIKRDAPLEDNKFKDVIAQIEDQELELIP